MTKLTGHDLIKWGFKPGEIFRTLLKHANKRKSEGATYEDIRQELKKIEEDNEKILFTKREVPIEWNELIEIDPENEAEVKNLDSVRTSMSVAMTVPVISAGAILPDACPAGVAPVGSVIKSEGIHPGLHSADICCSVACTQLNIPSEYINASGLTDSALESTHFGVGKNENVLPAFRNIALEHFDQSNIFLQDLHERASNDLGTQGDGNHFLYIGSRKSTGKLALVTHHGSRSLGAHVYKRGIAISRKECGTISKNMGTLSWFDPKSDLGEQYWNALQYIRWWTKLNHIAIHDLVSTKWKGLSGMDDAKIEEFFWNEHNFVFERDGYYYHAKGATPNYAGFSKDDSGKTLVPLNMGEPILILEHTDNENSLGFAPHGAGRNMSRTQYLKGTDEHPYPEGVEVRFFTGEPDFSELPGAYKCAKHVRSSIERFDIGKVVDEIEPIGSIMAGQIDWKKLRKKRKSKNE